MPVDASAVENVNTAPPPGRKSNSPRIGRGGALTLVSPGSCVSGVCSRAGGGGSQLTADGLSAARLCWAEGGGNARDCAAVLHVVTRRHQTAGARHGWTWLETFQRYSAAHPPRTPRQRLAASLPDGDVPGWTGRQNARWLATRETVVAFAQGDVADPCRGGPTHFGGAMDAQPAGMVRARRAGVENRFYRRVKR